MRTLAICVPGRAGEPGDDCVGACEDAVAVADGVGSAALGSLGSHTAVALALGEVRDAVRAGASPRDLEGLVARRYAAITGGDPAVSSTCLFAIGDADRVVVGQAGDGLAHVLLRDGHTSLRSGRGSWANETTALPRATVCCRDWPRASVRAVMLATDGVSDDLMAGREPELLATLCDALSREGAAAVETRLRQWLTAWPTPRSVDDRSLALLFLEDS